MISGFARVSHAARRPSDAAGDQIARNGSLTHLVTVVNMPEPTSGVADVLRAAYYYAITDGLAVVDGAVLLVAAARNDSRQALPVLGRAVAQARAGLTALDTSSSAATALAMQASSQAAALREARWWVLRDSSPQQRPAFGLVTAIDGGPAWGADVCRALRHATDSAAPSAALGMPQLLTGLLTEPGSTVQRLAASTGLIVIEARSATQTLPPYSGEPFTPLVDILTPLGAVLAHVPWPARWVPKLMSALTDRNPATGGPVLTGLQQEAMRQAVMMGHGVVQTSAVLLAMLSLHEQLAAAGRALAPRYQAHNRGGEVLAVLGLDTAGVRNAGEDVTVESAVVTADDARARFWASGKPADPAWAEAAVQAWDAAGHLARRHGHQDIGTSHLLAVLVDQPTSASRQLLDRLGLSAGQVTAVLGPVADD